MPDREFSRLERHLLSAGIRPRCARRAVAELRDHFEDIRAEALDEGMSPSQAGEEARCRLGPLDDVALEMCRRTELKTWPYRYPRLARVWLPFAYVTLLPATPIIAGIERAPVIARWVACAMLGAAVTATMMLILQLSILFA